MHPLFVYLLQASGCMLLFYVVYYTLLRRLTFFTCNRIYLVMSLLISLVIPILTIQIGINNNSSIKHFIPRWHIETADSSSNTFVNDSGMEFNTILLFIYATGSVLMLIKFVLNLQNILKVYFKKADKISGHIRIVKGTEKINNCSFLDTIFVDAKAMNTDEYEQIVKHEECHIQQYHSYDKLFIHLVKIAFWFNPVIYLYTRSLEEIHEFEADSLLTKQTDKHEYANLLLRIAISNHIHLVNCFSRHSLKARIQMLFSGKSNKIKRLSYLAIIPLLALTITSFSLRVIITPGNNDKKTIPADKVKKTEQPFFTRKTVKDNKGNEFDEVRIHFGKTYITGAIEKGGKILYVIEGKNYEEEQVKKFTADEISRLNCPCKVQIREKDKDSLIFGEYDGIVEIKGKK